MFITQFITVAIVHLFAVMSPGPDFAVVTRNSLFNSRKVGIYTSLGIALGIMVHVTYSLLGVGLLISRSILLFNIIKFVGAAYLIFIGYKSLRAKPVAPLEVVEDPSRISIDNTVHKLNSLLYRTGNRRSTHRTWN
jgi:threonine/homoserine/homoserine lactone efflux protein